MRILVACEFSGIVRDALIARGHNAVSCDLIESERPGPHIVGNVLNVLDGGWDLALFFPPCTYLCSSGLHWNARRPKRQALTDEALEFVAKLLDAPVPKIALENPVGCISTAIRKPDQIIQPWQFGEDASKATCLWLKGLPKLKPTSIVPAKRRCPRCRDYYDETGMALWCPVCGRKLRSVWGNQTPSGQNKLGPSPTRAMDRARTYTGVAKAMSEQWF